MKTSSRDLITAASRGSSVLSSMKYGGRTPVKTKLTKQELVRRLVYGARRLAVFAAAIWYIVLSIEAASTAFTVMHGVVQDSTMKYDYTFSLMPVYLGNASIRNSPLVVELLGNMSTLREGTLYLQSPTTTSYVDCGTDAATFNAWTYSDSFLRNNFANLTTDTAYHLSFLDTSELVLPIVDCTSSAITMDDQATVSIFYLMRDKQNTDNMTIVMWRMVTQEYQLPEEYESGAAAAAMTVAYVPDMRASTAVTRYYVMRRGFPFQMNAYEPYRFVGESEEGMWVLESIPRDPAHEATKVVRTSCRFGFYVNAMTEQCNVVHLTWAPSTNPIDIVSSWHWVGNSIVRDSWGWVHGVHIYFVGTTLVNLLKAKQSRFWLGDAFVSVSSTLELRALLVLLTWIINGLWTVMEFALHESNELIELPPIFSFPAMIHADLLTLYLGLSGLLGQLLRERVDPALVVILRVVPNFSTFGLVILYVPMRKLYHYFFPSRIVLASHQSSPGSGTAESSSSLPWKSTLTVFEIATGAPLQNRVGLVSDYDNCVFIKGMKFASADGIYCNGFVIANGKWLIATDDLLSIVIMIVTRVRFRNEYAYEVDGHTVQHTARLICPQTMTLKELLQLNISTLT